MNLVEMLLLAFISGMQRSHHYGLFPYSHFQYYRLKDIG